MAEVVRAKCQSCHEHYNYYHMRKSNGFLYCPTCYLEMIGR